LGSGRAQPGIKDRQFVRSHVVGVHESSAMDELLCRHPDVTCDLPQKNGGNVPSAMIWDRGPTTIGVTVLHVRTSLAHQDKTEGLKDSAHLSRLEHRKASHDLPHLDGLGAHKLGCQGGLSLLEQHAQDLLEVFPQGIQRLPLGVSARKPRHISDVKPGVRALLNHRREGPHARTLHPQPFRRQSLPRARCRTFHSHPFTGSGGLAFLHISRLMITRSNRLGWARSSPRSACNAASERARMVRSDKPRNRIPDGPSPRPSGPMAGSLRSPCWLLACRPRSKHDPEAPEMEPTGAGPGPPAGRPTGDRRTDPASAAQHATLAILGP